MIGTDPKKFIFVHPPKTAGTSVESYFLARWYGLTNFRDSTSDIGNEHWCDPSSVKMHAGLETIEKHLVEQGEDIQDYFVFTIVRNPWDWAASFVSWVNDMGQDVSFREKVIRFCSGEYSHVGHVTTDTQLRYHWSPNKKIDYHIRYEKLEEGWRDVCGLLGMTYTPLPWTRFRPHKAPYTKMFCDFTRDLVAKTFARDIEHFGYKYGENEGPQRPPEYCSNQW